MANSKTLPEISDIDRTEIAARLIMFRRTANKSISDMVEATSISRSGILKMESDESNPTIASIAAYVTACGKTIGEFFAPWKRDNRKTG